jgi:hypothetical protein
MSGMFDAGKRLSLSFPYMAIGWWLEGLISEVQGERKLSEDFFEVHESLSGTLTLYFLL